MPPIENTSRGKSSCVVHDSTWQITSPPKQQEPSWNLPLEKQVIASCLSLKYDKAPCAEEFARNNNNSGFLQGNMPSVAKARSCKV